MEIKWVTPKFRYGLNPPAVYRLDFDNGFFYIGSSFRVKTRFSQWRTITKHNKFPNKIMAEKIVGATSAIATILELPDASVLKDRETFYLREYFDDQKFLNQSPNAYTNEGLKPIPEHLKRPKKIHKKRVPKPPKPPMEDKVWAYSKGVNQFDVEGNYIMSHISLTAAARHIGVHGSVIRDHFRCKAVRGILGKYVFRLVGDNSKWKILRATPKEKPILELSGKIVIDLNTGVFYYSAKEASEQMPHIKQKFFYKMLSGEKKNTTQFKYA